MKEFLGKIGRGLRQGRALVRKNPVKSAGVLAALGGAAGYGGEKAFGHPSINAVDFEDQIKRREKDRYLRNLQALMQEEAYD